MNRLILIVALMSSGIVVGEEIPFMNADDQAHYDSHQCSNHKAPKGFDIYANIAYVLEYCSSLVSIRDKDHVTGWKLHREAALVVDKIPCDCRYHTHRDNMSYNVYLEVADDLVKVSGVNSHMNQLCGRLSSVVNSSTQQ